MPNLSNALFSIQSVKALDKLAIAKGISGYELMCRAGEAAADFIENKWPHVKTAAIFCGSGNNGGDGYVLARLLVQKGHQVLVFAADNQSPKTETAQKAQQDFLGTGFKILEIEAASDLSNRTDIDLVVDALLGIGIKAPLKESYANLIQLINQIDAKVLALDVPSGIDADTGSVVNQAVSADVTLTFIGTKLGLCMGEALEYAGHLEFASLNVPAEIYQEVPILAERVTYPEVLQYLPNISVTQHKGKNGRVMIVGGGAVQYSGAVCLAGEAALRVGAGLVSASVAPPSLPMMARAPAELMCYAESNCEALSEIVARQDALVVGPGLSQNTWAQQIFAMVKDLTMPMVVDADGLNWLAKNPQKKANWILTPHPGEAARLLGISIEECESNCLQTARRLQEKYGGTIVLKGASTVIVDDAPKAFLIEGKVPALAVGGTGDVLAGMIGGFLATGLEKTTSAQLAVCLHREAGWIEQSFGKRGMIASELFPHIRTLLDPHRHIDSYE